MMREMCVKRFPIPRFGSIIRITLALMCEERCCQVGPRVKTCKKTKKEYTCAHDNKDSKRKDVSEFTACVKMDGCLVETGKGGGGEGGGDRKVQF